MEKSVLKLGTRKSLLALSQSTWVAQQIESKNPDIQVELVGIETRGDKIQDIPLSQTEGKEFFVAELDEALQSGKVDLNVHSLKDLSLDRPKEFKLFIPKRKNPRDVVIFSERVFDKISTGSSIRIGTSAPRRLENVPHFLNQALPILNENKPKTQFLEIRGNVNTRLSRLHEPDSSPKQLEGVVLAFAGLIRLYESSSAQNELLHLLKNTRWMVLPLQECPSAPGQGALAIECRASHKSAVDALAKLHDRTTENQIRDERELLSEYGGGCHQRFGVTTIEHPLLGECRFAKGRKPSSEEFFEVRHSTPPRSTGSCLPWNGSLVKANSKKLDVSLSSIPSETAFFVAHHRALQETSISKKSRIWTSGTSSWFELAKKGYWIEGCAEGLGFDWIEPVLEEKVLGLPASFDHWFVLSHQGAEKGWLEKGFKKQNIITTYQVLDFDQSELILQKIKQATHFYWSSPSQVEAYLEFCTQKPIHHACGPGKTAAFLTSRKVAHDVFMNNEEWEKWLKR